MRTIEKIDRCLTQCEEWLAIIIIIAVLTFFTTEIVRVAEDQARVKDEYISRCVDPTGHYERECPTGE